MAYSFKLRTLGAIAAVALFCAPATLFAVAQSAVITLIFPPGARATGLGEAFVALADDANATFFNPAGLGQPPLASSWKVELSPAQSILTCGATKRKLDFGAVPFIWAGTNNGIKRYVNGIWETENIHLAAQSESLRDIAIKYVKSDNDSIIDFAVHSLKKANGIGQKRFAAVRNVLTREILDSSIIRNRQLLEDLTWKITSIETDLDSVARVAAIIAPMVDSTKRTAIAQELARIRSFADVGFKDLVEIKIPYNIVLQDSITAILIDATGSVWAGTQHGLWKYSDTWKLYATIDGLPSDAVTCIAENPQGKIAVGTDKGYAVFESVLWKKASIPSKDSLVDSAVTAIAFDASGSLFVGTSHGLYKVSDSATTRFDTANGLLDNHVTALSMDSKNRLWIGGKNGLAVMQGITWKRYKFPGSTITCFGEESAEKMWIGTDRGAISCTQGNTVVSEDGKRIESTPEWKLFHSKNALTGDNIRTISYSANNLWITTKEALNQYAKANTQFLFFWEPLLPAFKIVDLWHTYAAVTIPTEDMGTFGLFVNYINFGETVLSDELGHDLPNKIRSFEFVLSACYGIMLVPDFSFGANAKYAHSALLPNFDGQGSGTAHVAAFDVGILKRNLIIPNLDFGLNLQNMGTNAYYTQPENADPIPFAIRTGFCYRALKTPVFDLKLLLDVDRELVKGTQPFFQSIVTSLIDEPWRDEARQIVVHAGTEFWYADFIAMRVGYLYDDEGFRKELTIGLGFKYGNTNFDWSYIHAPETSPARDQQWRASLILKI